MSGYFGDKLMALLPPIYRERDKDGDLRDFLSIPAATLDEIKSLIERLPDIWNVDGCDPKYLPVLSGIVGYSFDPTRDPDVQRREIKEIIESYRRKGSVPAIRRALTDVGWKGDIQETFRGALRLNKRSVIAQAKLPGRIHSLGVYRVECRNLTPGLRQALMPQQPAGMRVFFLQWLSSRESMEDFEAALARTVFLHSTGRIHDVFVVGRRLLNSEFRLTKRQSTWSQWRITCQSTLRQGFESAGVVIHRRHGRTPGYRLNGFTLNVRRLLNVELSERCLSFTCELETTEPGVMPVVLRLVHRRLNRSKLAHSTRSCRVLFRQKDLACFAQANFEMATNLYAVTCWPQT